MKKSLPQKLHTALLSTLLCTFTTFLFTGCAEYSVSNESEKEISSYEEVGSQIMNDYLDENIPDAALTSCVCYEVYDGDYRYITDYVEGYFDVDDISYFYRANIKTGDHYRYTSYKDKPAPYGVLILYEEYTCDGEGEVDISVEDPIDPDNFTIEIDNSQIRIDLETNTNYYLCFSDLSLLDGKDLYYYLDTTGDYTKATLKEDYFHYYSSSYYGGQRPIDQSEIFYIGHPEEE